MGAVKKIILTKQMPYCYNMNPPRVSLSLYWSVKWTEFCPSLKGTHGSHQHSGERKNTKYFK